MVGYQVGLLHGTMHASSVSQVGNGGKLILMAVYLMLVEMLQLLSLSCNICTREKNANVLGIKTFQIHMT